MFQFRQNIIYLYDLSYITLPPVRDHVDCTKRVTSIKDRGGVEGNLRESESKQTQSSGTKGLPSLGDKLRPGIWLLYA